jgi:hypothetical protein
MEEKQRKIIDLPLWVKKELAIEAIRKGYDGLKPYIEDLLLIKAKELKK